MHRSANADGVAIAAIKGLRQAMTELEARLLLERQTFEQRVSTLQSALQAKDRQVDALLERMMLLEQMVMEDSRVAGLHR